MRISESDESSYFSNWNPHFTPPWLSKRLTSHLPVDFSGAVVDPACGAGNLLAAAALRTGAFRRRSRGIEFIGTDTSVRAVRACERVLTTLLPGGNFCIHHGSFLKTAPTFKSSRAMVVMNPPFGGYGVLSKSLRKQVARFELKGRFNLGYAFVHRAITSYRPERLISLLPSNWIHSRTSAFRSHLDLLNGHWEWEDVGDGAFENIDVHLGILIWRRTRGKSLIAHPLAIHSDSSPSNIEVHQGIATGRDAVFFEISEKLLPFGKVARAVRGRDIGKESYTTIWIPPENLTFSQERKFKSLPRRILKELRERNCVISKRRRIFEYHETVPDWFCGSPKVLVPEIVTKRVRVELDADGTKLPLHSAIAIRVSSIASGRRLKQYIETTGVQKMLLTNGPRLAGGATRLQVGAIREALCGWSEIRRAVKKKRRQPTEVPTVRRR